MPPSGRNAEELTYSVRFSSHTLRTLPSIHIPAQIIRFFTKANSCQGYAFFPAPR